MPENEVATPKNNSVNSDASITEDWYTQLQEKREKVVTALFEQLSGLSFFEIELILKDLQHKAKLSSILKT